MGSQRVTVSASWYAMAWSTMRDDVSISSGYMHGEEEDGLIVVGYEVFAWHIVSNSRVEHWV